MMMMQEDEDGFVPEDIEMDSDDSWDEEEDAQLAPVGGGGRGREGGRGKRGGRGGAMMADIQNVISTLAGAGGGDESNEDGDSGSDDDEHLELFDDESSRFAYELDSPDEPYDLDLDKIYAFVENITGLYPFSLSLFLFLSLSLSLFLFLSLSRDPLLVQWFQLELVTHSLLVRVLPSDRRQNYRPLCKVWHRADSVTLPKAFP